VKEHISKTVSLGELILTVFDNAALYSVDPIEVSSLATQTVRHMLSRARDRGAVATSDRRPHRFN
jgi:hypothetical protein